MVWLLLRWIDDAMTSACEDCVFISRPGSPMKKGRFVLGTFRSERMRVLYRSRQNDRLRLISNLDSDEDIRLSERDCEESNEKTDIIDYIPVNPDIYIAKDGTEWILHNSNVPGRSPIRNVLRQSSSPTSFMKHNVNVSLL
ncbi:uncharacterized protein TNCV_4791271 [Trichonephila clavipes]|nr:uncharacterized protein TNCV_4791271 [Trichonephila clavipes]